MYAFAIRIYAMIFAGCVFVSIIVVKRLKISPSIFFIGAAAYFAAAVVDKIFSMSIFFSAYEHLPYAVYNVYVWAVYSAYIYFIILMIARTVKYKEPYIPNAIGFGLGYGILQVVHLILADLRPTLIIMLFYHHYEYDRDIFNFIAKIVHQLAGVVFSIFIALLIFKALRSGAKYFTFSICANIIWTILNFLSISYITASIRCTAAVIMMIYIVRQFRQSSNKEEMQIEQV